MHQVPSSQSGRIVCRVAMLLFAGLLPVGVDSTSAADVPSRPADVSGRRENTAASARGKPPLPPRWAFGHIKSKDEFKGRQDILSDVAWMAQHDVPCEVIHIDAPWAVGHNLFEFASAKVLHSQLHPETVGAVYDFGAPGERPYHADPDDPQCRPTNPPPHTGQGLIDTLHARGIRVTVWMTTKMNDGSAFGIGRFEGQSEREAPVFAFAEKSGFLQDKFTTWHRGAGKTIDYANPEAVAWWHRMMDKALDLGVDGFVLDFGGNEDYVRDTFRYLRAERGDQAIMMSRSAPQVADATLLVWAVDTKNDFSDKGIRYALEQILKSSENGTPFVSGTQSPHGASPGEAFVCREVQFNAFCPVQFTFCYGDLSNPWDHGALATRVFQYYTRLHHELIPYIYSAAIRASRTGEAIVKRSAGDLQYTFGDDLLVAPIYRDTTAREVAFPAGSEWIDYWDHEHVWNGGEHIVYEAPLDRIPLFIRAGGMIPMQVRKDWTGHGTETSAGALTLVVYPADESHREFLELNGDTKLHCIKRGAFRDRADVTFRVDGPRRAYVLRFKTWAPPEQVTIGNDPAPTRVASESDLEPGKPGWCFDAKSAFTIVRLPEVESSTMKLRFGRSVQKQ